MSPDPNRRRLQDLFENGFSAIDIAEALPSFDASEEVSVVRSILENDGRSIAGVRVAGRISGIVRLDDLKEGRCVDQMIALREETHVVDQEAPLPHVIQALAKSDFLLVQALSQPIGVITRGDLAKPVVRMWLFGLVTIIEIYFRRTIEERLPLGQWQDKISRTRLSKAERLRQERARRGQHVSALDCLQLSDKGQIILRVPELRDEFGFPSRKAGERVIKELESLRNNLAHSQDILAYNWDTIVLMAKRMDRILGRL